MKKHQWKAAALFALMLVPIGAVAGYFTILYQMQDILTADLLAAAMEQFGGREGLIAVYVVQTAAFAVFCGFFGFLLSKACGLMKPLRFEKPALLRTLLWSVVAGILFSLDYWTFGKWIPAVGAASVGTLNRDTVLASVLYGGIIEEVMLRLFFMSLLAWLIRKLFYRKVAAVPLVAVSAANIFAALLFAAGHLPATTMTFGGLSPLLVFRCFLFNGGFGLYFGWLYRKYGIQYAMLAHALVHIVSKIIWFTALC